jgi:hypothetical protein
VFLNLDNERYDYARLGFAPGCFSSVDRRPWILRITGTNGQCESQIQALRKSRSLPESNYLFIVDRWTEDELKGFSQGLALLRNLTKARIILVGQNATFLTFDDSLRFLGREQLLRLNSVLYQQQSLVDVQINQQLRMLAAMNDLEFIDRQSLVCSQDNSLCEVRAQGGEFLYSDSNHWSYAGRSVFGKLMVQRFGYEFASSPDPSSVPHP